MKKIIKKLFNWIFKEDLEVLRVEISKAKYFANETKKRLYTFDKVLSGIDVSVDVHEHDNRYSPSWAGISLQGQKTDYRKPIGLIGEKIINGNYITYGYDGESYYVGFGVLETLAFGRMEMTFEEARSAFYAIDFYSLDVNKWDFNSAKKVLKESRKNKLSGDDLMFFFGNLFKEFNC